MNLFPLGQVVATPGAPAALEASGESLLTYLQRHLAGDWGDVDAEDAQENELSLEHSCLYFVARRILTRAWRADEWHATTSGARHTGKNEPSDLRRSRGGLLWLEILCIQVRRSI